MNTNFFPQPKPRPAALERADRRKALTATDDKESAKVKVRSGGRCEVRWVLSIARVEYRCHRRAFHVHHMIGGNGKRGRGESAKAIRKQHVCPDHHAAIGNNTLRRVGGMVPHFTDSYERVR